MLNVVKEIINFCNENSIDVIFEKVEKKEELDRLVKIGGKFFQGWYFKDHFLSDDSLDKVKVKIEENLLKTK